MVRLDQKCLRTTRLSISVPARKVSRMAPKPARKFTHSVRCRPMTLPATAPTTISTRAMDIATRIEMIEASKARPSQTADANQTFSIAHSFRPQRPNRCEREGGKTKPASRRVMAGTLPHAFAREESLAVIGGFLGGHPPFGFLQKKNFICRRLS